MKRIHEFEALRGLLALWVLVSHVLSRAGLSDALGPFAIIGRPDFAVDVFIMLSGFVIFDLLDTKREQFSTFITRRFFRIFPIYLLALVTSYFLAADMLAWLTSLPWQTKALGASIEFAKASTDHLNQHLLAHLTGFHGLVPSTILPHSDMAILAQAWSISVEWQFYLIAPLLYFSLRRQPLLLAGGVVGLMVLHSFYWLGEGFALNHANSFLVGIVSYFAYKNCPRIEGSHIVLGAAVGLAAAAWLTSRPVPLLVWALFMALAIHSKHTVKTNALSGLLATRPFQFLGRVSYSIYLLHMLVIFAVSDAVLKSVHQYLGRPIWQSLCR